MKTQNLHVRLSEKRMKKLKGYAQEKEKTITQLIEDWIDRLPVNKSIDWLRTSGESAVHPHPTNVEGQDFRDYVKTNRDFRCLSLVKYYYIKEFTAVVITIHNRIVFVMGSHRFKSMVDSVVSTRGESGSTRSLSRSRRGH